MTRATRYRHEFVRAFPDRLEDGVLYVSTEFASTAHLCLCGCGHEVYAPLSSRGWQMLFDGQTVSLDPSIGNWSFPCQSHYWLDRGRVTWAARWSREQIEAGRKRDRLGRGGADRRIPASGQPPAARRSALARFLRWLIGS